MFWNKEEPQAHDELTVSEFIALDLRLNDMIRQWTIKEVGQGLQPNTKLSEIAIFNFKLILSSGEHGNAMREFIKHSKSVNDDTEFIFSRIQDLYIYLTMSFPKYFLDSIRNKYVESLISIGYDVNEEIADQNEYVWLLPKIQHCLRYETTAVTTEQRR